MEIRNSDGDTVIANFASRHETCAPPVHTVSNKHDTTKLTEPVEQQGKMLHSGQALNLTVANSIIKKTLHSRLHKRLRPCPDVAMWQRKMRSELQLYTETETLLKEIMCVSV